MDNQRKMIASRPTWEERPILRYMNRGASIFRRHDDDLNYTLNVPLMRVMRNTVESFIDRDWIAENRTPEGIFYRLTAAGRDALTAEERT